MNTVDLFLAENENFKYVTCKFLGTSKAYVYKTLFEVEVGDSAVVMAPNTGLTVVEVTEVALAIESNLSYQGDVKWLVSVIDTKAYEKLKETEREVRAVLNKAEAKKRREEFQSDLANRVGDEAIKTAKGLIRL